MNRLDLNVLADYRWPRLLGAADAFVQQVPGDADIADYLSSLAEGSTAAPGRHVRCGSACGADQHRGQRSKRQARCSQRQQKGARCRRCVVL